MKLSVLLEENSKIENIFKKHFLELIQHNPFIRAISIMSNYLGMKREEGMEMAMKILSFKIHNLNSFDDLTNYERTLGKNWAICDGVTSFNHYKKLGEIYILYLNDSAVLAVNENGVNTITDLSQCIAWCSLIKIVNDKIEIKVDRIKCYTSSS